MRYGFFRVCSFIISKLLILVGILSIALCFYLSFHNGYFNTFNKIGCQHAKFDNVTLVTYAAGRPSHYLNQILLSRSAHDHGIDRIFNYSPNDLDYNFYQRNKDILDLKRGAGYWLWKPYIILDSMKRLPRGSIIAYMDSDCYITKDISPLVSLAMTHDRVLWKNSHTNKPYTKRDTYIVLEKDYQEAYDATQLEAGFLLLKNTKENEEFVKRWLYYCQHSSKIITDEPSKLGLELKDFKKHRHDQAILSLLSLSETKHKLLEHEYVKQFFVKHNGARILSFIKYVGKYMRNLQPKQML
jgi:hypothetical protein